MNKIASLWVGVLLLMGIACSPATEEGQGDDSAGPLADKVAYRVAARVNGVPILGRSVEEIVEAERARMDARGLDPTPEVLEGLRRSALDLLISSELVVQAAQEEGLAVSDEAIEQQLAEAHSRFGSSDAFTDYLSANGLTVEDWKDDARRRAVMAAYAEKITTDLDVDLEVAARRIYEDRLDQFRESDEVHVERIIVRFLPSDPPDVRAAAQEKIAAAHRRLLAGEDFKAVAAEVSESPFADQGGDMGWFARGRTLPEFEEQVFSTDVGSISDVFETRHGLNIIKVLERRAGRERSFDEVRTELMLVLVREQSDESLRAHVLELRDAADVELIE